MYYALLILMNVGFFINFYYSKKKKLNEVKKRNQTLETIEILLAKQIEYMENDIDPCIQMEISKYINDFLLSELKHSRFTPHGLKYAHSFIVRKIPEVQKYYREKLEV